MKRAQFRDGATFLERLASLDKMTPSERKLARHFEKEYPALAFDNLASLSEKVAVGKSTVSRFIARLGYPDFHIFLRRLREEVARNLDNPLNRHAKNRRASSSVLSSQLEDVRRNLQQTGERIRHEDFSRALTLLADEKRHLYLMGSATAEPLVTYFYLLSRYLRSNSTLLDGNSPTIAHRLDRVDERSLLFALAFNRYPTLTANVLRYFRAKGAQVILLTDRLTCPMLGNATLPLIVHAEGEGMFKTRCSAVAVMEALLEGMAVKRSSTIPARYEEMHETMKELDVYLRD